MAPFHVMPFIIFHFGHYDLQVRHNQSSPPGILGKHSLDESCKSRPSHRVDGYLAKRLLILKVLFLHLLGCNEANAELI